MPQASTPDVSTLEPSVATNSRNVLAAKTIRYLRSYKRGGVEELGPCLRQ